MLGKLFKYDMKAVSRILLPISIFVIVYSFIAGFLLNFEDYPTPVRIVAVLALVAYFLLLVAYAMSGYFVIAHNFYKTMVTDQGYLTHTLPVKISSIIFSKLLVAFLWSVIIVIVFCISIPLLIFLQVDFREIPIREMIEFLGSFDVSYTYTVIIFILLMIGSLFVSQLMIFAAIALGQLLQKHKLLFSIIFYFGLSTAIQTIYSVILGILSIGQIDVLETEYLPDVLSFYNIYLTAAFFINALVFAGLFFCTKYIFEKKLNLE
ncbi:hypothetical protein [Anaeromicropila populeti]|uniref:ABC-2 family transporter protein n=1 Tax=Anaeromicropila populeti TaxID=37658 RepID=A0A1I6HU78_9FIRM|nr:hypothetical protein [Anaeromicropila populeti]SFR57957.1 hypothetical protein SAMN05661086_00294 [Anaeromicropila populeti]